MNTDPEKVPATPVYTITLTSAGTATVDGEVITTDGADVDEARVAALSEIRIKAALHGRPVRVTAKEADGSAWPLIVDVDGSVTTLNHPHPVEPSEEAPPAAPAPAQAPPRPSSAPAPQSPDPSFTITLDEAPGWATPQRPAEAKLDWSAPLPAPYRPLWAELVAHETAGDLVEAIITADRIETALAEQYGETHPHTVNVMTVRAWLTLRRRSEWAETTELLVETARRRQKANAPQEETARTVRNSHGAWRQVTKEDPEYALEVADQVMDLLDGDAQRSRDVVRWVESGAAGRRKGP